MLRPFCCGLLCTGTGTSTGMVPGVLPVMRQRAYEVMRDGATIIYYFFYEHHPPEWVTNTTQYCNIAILMILIPVLHVCIAIPVAAAYATIPVYQVYGRNKQTIPGTRVPVYGIVQYWNGCAGEQWPGGRWEEAPFHGMHSMHGMECIAWFHAIAWHSMHTIYQ